MRIKNVELKSENFAFNYRVWQVKWVQNFEPEKQGKEKMPGGKLIYG